MLLLIVSVVLTSCSKGNNNPLVVNGHHEPFEITRETEYAGYRVLIEQAYVQGDVTNIVIESETRFNPSYRVDSLMNTSTKLIGQPHRIIPMQLSRFNPFP